ncbi:MAG: hypothetical protein HC852_15890 [Acaryochloridaceae cyanobacterium RU_4_10]|jgi:hypothetical protein|nr:hypothetical protein [Acaryochloridaceae cyanobacterium RU_4_10]
MNIIKVTQDVENQEDFNDWVDLALELLKRFAENAIMGDGSGSSRN